MAKTMNARMQQKNDIAANWQIAGDNKFIPLDGEIIVYSDLNKIKIGDGTTNVNKLSFTNGSVGLIIEQGGEIFNDYENNQAAGLYSHAEGSDTHAYGVSSHAGGLGTIASEDNQTAIGQYNAEDADALFIVGNGTDYGHKSNAFAVNKDGSATLAKVGESGNNIATVGYVKENLPLVDEYIKKTDYATDGVAGIVRKATDGELDERAEDCFVSPAQIDYMFTEVLCYPKEEWDDSYKKKARNTIGAVGITDYATKVKGGVVKVDPSVGGLKVSSGSLETAPATYSIIDNRRPTNYVGGTTEPNTRYPIVSATIDYSVKSVLTNSKIEWTDEEKAKARMQLGAAGLDNIINVEYLNAQLNALITVADIDAICGGNIVAASEVTF